MIFYKLTRCDIQYAAKQANEASALCVYAQLHICALYTRLILNAVYPFLKCEAMFKHKMSVSVCPPYPVLLLTSSCLHNSAQHVYSFSPGVRLIWPRCQAQLLPLGVSFNSCSLCLPQLLPRCETQLFPRCQFSQLLTRFSLSCSRGVRPSCSLGVWLR